MTPPLVSIGVTTYQRPTVLKRAVESVLAQQDQHIEILIGNDAPHAPLDLAALGLADPRVRLLQWADNQGEHGNMNALLGHARGSIFTWLADDDGYDPGVLAAVRAHWQPSVELQAVALPFRVDAQADNTAPWQWSGGGRDFLTGYLAGRFPTVGTYVFYPRSWLLEQGGISRLSQARHALFGEYELLTRMCTLARVTYVHGPRVYLDGELSWGRSARDRDLYVEAAINLCVRCWPILRAQYPGRAAARALGLLVTLGLDVCAEKMQGAPPGSRKLALAQILTGVWRGCAAVTPVGDWVHVNRALAGSALRAGASWLPPWPRPARLQRTLQYARFWR